MRGKSSTTLNLARKKDDDDDVFLNNNNALSFIKPYSFLTNDDCVFREDKAVIRTNVRFSVRAWRGRAKALRREMVEKSSGTFIVVVFCVYFGRDVTQHSLVWIGRARVCTHTRSIKKRSYCRRLSTSLTGTFLSSFFVKK